MSQLECPVVRVEIVPHPNADTIEIAKVGARQCVVKKRQFKTGDFAVYIPEQAVLPVWLLKELNLWDAANNKGLLSSRAGSRVRSMKLRGVLSQGLLYSSGWLPDSMEEYGVQFMTVPRLEKLGVVNASELTVPSIEWESYVFDPILVNEGDDFSDLLGIDKYEPPTLAPKRASNFDHL